MKGANEHLSKEHIDQAVDLLQKAKVALFQLEIDLNVTLYALKKAKENNCKLFHKYVLKYIIDILFIYFNIHLYEFKNIYYLF